MSLDIQISLDANTGEIYGGPPHASGRPRKGRSRLAFPDDYVVIDLETTGLDPRWDEIVEVAAVKFENRAETGRFQSFVKPSRRIDAEITALTGITNEMLKGVPRPAEILPAFFDFIWNFPVVGYNVNFDVNFLYDYAAELELAPFTNDYIDTVQISRRLYEDLPDRRLSSLAAHLGVEPQPAHRALPDCLQTQLCFEAMRAEADRRGGIPKLSWERFNSLSKTIHPNLEKANPDSPLFGRTVAFTGKLERMTRKEAMQAAADAGGICCDGVTAATNYLILGNQDYCKALQGGKSAKQKKAEKMKTEGMDISILSENVFYDMLGL